MKTLFRIALIVIVLLNCQAITAQVDLVIDMDSSEYTYGSNPRCFIHYQGVEYFGAEDFRGRGFWKSDGTRTGTVQVTRMLYPYYATVFMEKLFILGYRQDGFYEYGLWISDGTEEGTTLLKELARDVVPEFTIVGEQLFFRVENIQTELWVTKGTAETTKRVGGDGTSFYNPEHLTAIGNLLYFTATSGEFSTEAWRSDGTEEGTFMLTNAQSTDPYGYCLHHNEVFFLANEDQGAGLYATDGTLENARLVASLPEQVALLDNYYSQGSKEMHNHNDTLYFALKNPDTRMSDLYCYGGGDSLLLCLSFDQSTSARVASFFPLQNALVAGVVYYPSGNSQMQLMLMRLEGAGAYLYDSIQTISSFWNPYALQFTDTVAYFVFGNRIWRSNGTTDGTWNVNDHYLSSLYSTDNKPFDVVVDRMFFTWANDSLHYEPWVQDIYSGEIELLKDINRTKSTTSLAIQYADDHNIYFTASSINEGNELWITSTDKASAQLLRDINPGTEKSSPSSFLFYENELYFTATDQDKNMYFNGVELNSHIWKTDGTQEGTVKALNVSTRFSYYSGSGGVCPEKFELNGKMIFAGYFPGLWPSNIELMQSAGTEGGTSLVKDRDTTNYGFPEYTNPAVLRKAGSNIFFIASTGEEGTELWVTDGSSDGTRMVKDIAIGHGSSLGYQLHEHNMTVLGEKLIFTPDDWVNRRELWVSDGSELGTFILAETTVSNFPVFYYLTSVNDKVYFWVRDSDRITDMWVTDGTVDGTFPLRELAASWSYGINEVPLGSFGDAFFFRGSDGDHGFELWKSDGTTEGTHLFKDLLPGAGHSYPGNFFLFKDKFYFIAYSDMETPVLWSSDGTEEGTQPVEDWQVTEMKGLNNPTVCGEYFYFSASDLDHGEALFRFHLGELTDLEVETQSVNIYPNPAADEIIIEALNLSGESCSVQILDLSGRPVFSKRISITKDPGTRIELTDIDPGIYLLVLQTDSGNITSKFVKE